MLNNMLYWFILPYCYKHNSMVKAPPQKNAVFLLPDRTMCRIRSRRSRLRRCHAEKWLFSGGWIFYDFLHHMRSKLHFFTTIAIKKPKFPIFLPIVSLFPPKNPTSFPHLSHGNPDYPWPSIGRHRAGDLPWSWLDVECHSLHGQQGGRLDGNMVPRYEGPTEWWVSLVNVFF